MTNCKQCTSKNKNNTRCKNKIKNGKCCYLHKWGSRQSSIKNNNKLFNRWLTKEIKRIKKNTKKYSYVSFIEPTAYVKNKKIAIVSIEEDDDVDEYFITYGIQGKRLKVDHIRVKGNIRKYIKDRFPNYKKQNKLEKIIEDAYLSV